MNPTDPFGIQRNLAEPFGPKINLDQDNQDLSEAVKDPKSPVTAGVKNSEAPKAPQGSAGPQQDPWDPFLEEVEDGDR